jgi:hypothetical protein
MKKGYLLMLCVLACSGTNGVDGAGVLVRVTPEAPGANCPNGGSRIEAGQDSNFNGQLENAEVTSSAFICNGENGQDGEDGQDGQNGQNGQGLDPFGPVLQGSFELRNEEDLEKFLPVEELTGALVIDLRGFSSITLPNLQQAESVFVFQGDAQTLALPSLTTVRDFSVAGVGNLVSLDISNLSTVDNLVFQGANISELSVPLVVSLDFLQLIGNNQLGLIEFPSLSFVEDLLIASNPLLPTCQAQNLLAQLSPQPNTIQIIGNNDAGICP